LSHGPTLEIDSEVFATATAASAANADLVTPSASPSTLQAAPSSGSALSLESLVYV
jgi:hypothetical protein